MITKQFIKAALLSGVIFQIAAINNSANARRRVILGRKEDVRDTEKIF